MKVLLNGDSNMSGEELDDVSLSIGHQFCHILGGKAVNLSYTGSSNDRIYDTTMAYITNNPVDFVLIGWSEMSRVQWFTNAEGQGKFYEINNLGVGKQPLPYEYQERYNHWRKFMADDWQFGKVMGWYWREKIYNLHCLMNYKKIPHLFFHAFHRFHVYDKQYQLNWHDRFIDPYENPNTLPTTYIHWSRNNGYQEITPGWFHYEPAAQRAWAELLVDHVNTYDLTTI